MAEKQTYIIHINKGCKDSDFYRVTCKKLSTCKKYLQNWYIQGKRYGNLYAGFYRDGATYEIEETPDGYSGHIVASGLMSEFKEY